MTDQQWLIQYSTTFGHASPCCRKAIAPATGCCSACGCALRLDVRIADPYLRSWALALMGACLAAGVALMLGLIVLVRVEILDYGRPGVRYVNLGILAMGAVMAVLAFRLLRNRTGFQAKPRHMQWLIAGGALLAALAAFAGPALMIQ